MITANSFFTEKILEVMEYSTVSEYSDHFKNRFYCEKYSILMEISNEAPFCVESLCGDQD